MPDGRELNVSDVPVAENISPVEFTAMAQAPARQRATRTVATVDSVWRVTPRMTRVRLVSGALAELAVL
ncbi:MAG TPA: hypothetical protein VFO16_20485, partial [Pseudonocardiaceae bacterium]|nr:hypothetical protein [Pseudonocardiaceae bacterium]